MTDKKELFPLKFIVIGILICSIVTGARMELHNAEDPVALLGIIAVSGLIGYIPMKIAYEKQTVHRHGIYVLSVIAMSIGSILVSVAAILWACFDKKSATV